MAQLHHSDHHCDHHRGTTASDVPRRYAWIVFALTFGLLISDYMSRQVLNAVFPLLKEEWVLSDSQLGLLAGIVALMVGLLTVPLSLLADRFGRVRSLTLMAILWSLATLMCALSDNFEQMLTARFFVGIGEAAYGSVGIAVVLSVFPARLRATLTGAFMAGGMFGSVLGMGLGGVIATALTWRWAFACMALFGLALAFIYPLIVREARIAPRNARNEAAPLPPLRLRLAGLVSSRSVICAYIGSGLQLFIGGAMIAWMPSYLNRYYDMATDKAGALAAVFVLTAGAGMVLCGIVSDRVSQNLPQRKFLLACSYCIATFLLLSAAFQLPPGPLQLLLIGAGMFVAAGTSGPAGAMVANLTHATIHGTAFATLTLVNNLLGLAPGPLVTGRLADSFGLGSALQIIPLVSLAAAIAFYIGKRNYLKDLQGVHAGNEGNVPLETRVQ
ncbi:MFS transporter [Microbulbifer harenosus]|uniref:MFS transporter n=1 Tax=Microbulbifer harenosus TaxID=2576840 RepID=A0ABY2UHN9_9GAMM|nr:MFS transporter [Microbulbifer harenosus]TLM77339.1 MFS transporter [Microbulbifer harenosus]